VRVSRPPHGQTERVGADTSLSMHAEVSLKIARVGQRKETRKPSNFDPNEARIQWSSQQRKIGRNPP